jgi:hypothetical protein
VHTKSLKMVLDDYTGESKTIKRTADVALRKYATILQYSEDNGETFQEFPSLKYCGKCGDKVLKLESKPINLILCRLYYVLIEKSNQK